MLKLYDGELLHSLIFRTHLVYGVSRHKGVLSTKGGWRGFPVIFKETRSVYGHIDEIGILRALRHIGFAQEQENLFRGSPFQYRSELESCLDEASLRGYPSRPIRNIRFCYQCISEQLSRYGVGYILTNWFRGDYCYTHEVPLCCVTDSNAASSADSLKRILRGERLENSMVLKPELYLPKDDFYRFNTIKFAECAVSEFHRFVREKGHFFPEVVSRVIRTNLVHGMSETNLSKPAFKEQIYETLEKLRFEPLTDFIASRLEEKIVDVGVLNPKAIKEPVLKSKVESCDECIRYGCFARVRK